MWWPSDYKKELILLTAAVTERESQSKLSGPFLLATAPVIHLHCNKMHSYYFMKEEPNMKTPRRSSVLDNLIIVYCCTDLTLPPSRLVDSKPWLKGVSFNIFRVRLWCTSALWRTESWSWAHFWKPKVVFAPDCYTPAAISPLCLAGLTSKQIWKLHSVTWCVMRGYQGLKLLFHLTLCNLLSSHQCWHHQTAELLYIYTKCRH